MYKQFPKSYLGFSSLLSQPKVNTSKAWEKNFTWICSWNIQSLASHNGPPCHCQESSLSTGTWGVIQPPPNESCINNKYFGWGDSLGTKAFVNPTLWHLPTLWPPKHQQCDFRVQSQKQPLNTTRCGYPSRLLSIPSLALTFPTQHRITYFSIFENTSNSPRLTLLQRCLVIPAFTLSQ